MYVLLCGRRWALYDVASRMKARIPFLLSLLLNLFLIIVLAGIGKNRGKSRMSRKSETDAQLTETKYGTTVMTIEGQPVPVLFHWSLVESRDYRFYIANLRAIGCPEETIRDIIIAEVNRLYWPKLAALAMDTLHF